MVSYGYTLDHIAPARRAADDKPFPPAICTAVILGSNVALWLGVMKIAERLGS